MTKIIKVGWFLFISNSNSLLLTIIGVYLFSVSNVLIWTKKENLYVANSSYFSKIFYDSLISNYTFIFGMAFILKYFTEYKNGLYTRLLLNGFSRHSLLKLEYYRILFLLLFSIFLFFIYYYIVQFLQFESIKFAFCTATYFYLIAILIITFYTLCLAYFLSLIIKNMIFAIFLLFFITKTDVILSYFEVFYPKISRFNYLPISCVSHFILANTSYISILIFIIQLILINWIIKRKQLKINFY